jgi:hypothetical protein
MPHKQYVISKLALADAAHISQQLFAAYKTVDSDHIICPVREYARRRHHKIYE